VIFGRALYSVYEAKKFAEGAPTVGKTTSLSVLHKDGRHEILSGAGREYLNQKFEELGPQIVPQDLSVPANCLAEVRGKLDEFSPPSATEG
jgi:hypothetical protein